ncbi:MAG: DUF1003 domain-containing protein [Gammaproteobacteria bacterium]|nr:DUF1003 domain-containing protein [Gammaproteobacteria bacterium]
MTASVEMLSRVHMFQRMDDDERAAVCALLQTRHFDAGETIFNFGDDSEDFYIVYTGRVRIHIETTEGDTIVLREVGPGEIFGDISMFDGGPRTATVTAIEDTEVLFMGQEELLVLVKRFPDAALDLLSVMGTRLRAVNDMLRTQVTRNVNIEEEETLTFGQRIADRVANVGGSWTFIITFSAFLFAWMGLNVWLAMRAFDPFPFILLNLVLSTLAAFQAPVIMMSQNRQASKDRLKADLDYRVNLKTELEVAHLHNKLDRVYEQVQRSHTRIERLARAAPQS